MALCRIVFFLWRSPPGADTTETEKHYLLNILLRLFDPQSSYTRLKQQDFKNFVDEDIIAGFGAGPFLSHLTSVLNHLPVSKRNNNSGETLISVIHDVGIAILRTAFKPHFASSGVLKAILDFAYTPLIHGLVVTAD